MLYLMLSVAFVLGIVIGAVGMFFAIRRGIRLETDANARGEIAPGIQFNFGPSLYDK